MDGPVVIPAPAYADYVLGDLQAWRREGMRTALLTLIRVDGHSPRPVGSQMAVREDGRAVGALTGGCAERALVLDALAAMARGENHVELYGEGSRYKDIELPCGSGILVLFDVSLSDETLDGLVEARSARQPAWMIIDEGRLRASTSLTAPQDAAGQLILPYLPQCRLVLAGQGTVTLSAARLAAALEMAVEVHTPDRDVGLQLAEDVPVFDLASAGDFRPVLDAWTAVAVTFHNHNFEAAVLGAVLDSPAFFIGALGSRRTHAARLETLRQAAWDDEALARIQGPIGLDLGARTPPEIALSIVAQVVASWRARFR